MIPVLRKVGFLSIATAWGAFALLPGRTEAQHIWNVDISTNSDSGDSAVGVSAVNSAGLVTGYAQNNDSSDSNAFTFNPITNVFTKIANPSDGNFGGGSAINAAGVVVGAYSPTDGSANSSYSFGTDASGVAHNLGTLNGTGNYIITQATGISDSGLIGGYSTAPDGLYHGFQYTGTPGSGTLVDLGVATAGQSTVLNGMSHSGLYMAGIDQGGATAPEQGTVYIGTPGSGGHFVDLGTFFDAKDTPKGSPNGSTETTYLQAINDSGLAVGYDFRSYSSYHAMAYTGPLGSGTWNDLGVLPDDSLSHHDASYDSSYAYGVDDNGDIVGSSAAEGGKDSHAFVYIGTPGAGGHMVDLNDWFAATYPTEAAGWDLQTAYGISDTGWIIGQGTYTGASDAVAASGFEYSAFEIDASALFQTSVPEPTSLTLMGLAALPLLARRRRASRR
jgi:probable HAF family extracellular repeat protein